MALWQVSDIIRSLDRFPYHRLLLWVVMPRRASANPIQTPCTRKGLASELLSKTGKSYLRNKSCKKLDRKKNMLSYKRLLSRFMHT